MSITVVEHARFLISRFSKNKQLIPLRKSLQTMSASPCRTQVQPAASFLVCSLIFIEYKKTKQCIKMIKNGSIIFVVGKSPMDIMEPIFV